MYMIVHSIPAEPQISQCILIICTLYNVHVTLYQPAVLCTPGWFYSYFATFASVCPSVQDLEGPGNESVTYAAGTYMYGFSWFVHLLGTKGSQ